MEKEEKETRQNKIKREYKSRLFEMIFSQKEQLLELYNAMSGSHYTDPDSLEINTLENAIYLSMHNDLSFVIGFQLYMYEHQSTYNPNLPLRDLLYISELYSDMIKDHNIYGRKKVEIPTPHFVVFYNGTESRPEREEFRLSDLFKVKEDEVELELIVTVLNINKGYNQKLIDSCKTLSDYCEYIHRVRTYMKEMSLGAAVEKAVTECIEEGILADFLKKYRAEAIKVSIYEFDEEQFVRLTKQEGYEEGKAEGYERGNIEGYEKCQIDMILKKLAKGKSLPVIADEMEEDIAVIEKLVANITNES